MGQRRKDSQGKFESKKQKTKDPNQMNKTHIGLNGNATYQNLWGIAQTM